MHARAPAAPGAQLTLLCGVEGKTHRGSQLAGRGLRTVQLPEVSSLQAGTQAAQEQRETSEPQLLRAWAEGSSEACAGRVGLWLALKGKASRRE